VVFLAAAVDVGIRHHWLIVVKFQLTLWCSLSHSVLSVRLPGCQKLQMTA